MVQQAAIAGALAALASACRAVLPRSPAAQDASVPLKVEPATIRFGASGSDTERPVWQAITETFNQKGTGITVEYEPCVSECLDKYATQYLAGTAPDVFRIDDEPMPFYAAKGMYYELDRLVARDSKELNLDDFFPRSITAFRFDQTTQRHGMGKLYALPFNTGGDMVWFNRGAFIKAGVEPPPVDGNWTLDDFLAKAKAMTSFEGTQLKTVGLNNAPRFRVNLSFLWSFGATLLDERGRWAVNTPETVRAYQWLADLRHRHKVIPWGNDFAGMGNIFLQGLSAMWIAFPFIRPDILARPELDWDVTHFPKAPNGQRYTRETSDGVGMPSNTKYVEQAWVFVKYICSAEGQKEFARLGRAVPSRRSVANSPEYLRPDTPQHEENIVKALEYSRLQPITMNFQLAERAIARYEVPLYDDTIMMPPQKMVQQLQDVLRQLDATGQLPPDWEPKP